MNDQKKEQSKERLLLPSFLIQDDVINTDYKLSDDLDSGSEKGVKYINII